MERCDNCGIACYYHGSGANQAYHDAMDRKYKQAQLEQAEREAAEREQWENENIRNDLYY